MKTDVLLINDGQANNIKQTGIRSTNEGKAGSLMGVKNAGELGSRRCICACMSINQ